MGHMAIQTKFKCEPSPSLQLSKQSTYLYYYIVVKGFFITKNNLQGQKIHNSVEGLPPFSKLLILIYRDTYVRHPIVAEWLQQTTFLLHNLLKIQSFMLQ